MTGPRQKPFSYRQSSSSLETVYPLGCPLGKAYRLPAACLPVMKLIMFIGLCQVITLFYLMHQAETKMGTPVRETEGICVLRTKSVCAVVAFFTLNSPYMLKKF